MSQIRIEQQPRKKTPKPEPRKKRFQRPVKLPPRPLPKKKKK